MTRFVALLRGINVGGNRKIPMADLRAMLGAAGLSDVATYVQSGNAVFTSPRGDTAELARDIERRITQDTGHDVTVLVLTRDDLAAAVAANPFPDPAAAPTRHHLAFLSSAPDTADVAKIAAVAGEDEFRVIGRIVYLRYAGLSSDSKLTNDLIERRLGVRSTARNWNTATKLLALADALPA